MWGLCLLGSGILKGEIHELLPLHHLAMLPGISPCFVSSCHYNSDCTRTLCQILCVTNAFLRHAQASKEIYFMEKETCCVAKETFPRGKRGLKRGSTALEYLRHAKAAKETYAYEQRPTPMDKETYFLVKETHLHSYLSGTRLSCSLCSLTIECVLLLQNVFSYYRMCSLTIECVLLL